jgi:hypothetical protein
MSPESMTNVLLITLISLIAFIGKIALGKINDLIKDVKSLLMSDMLNKNNISNLQNDIENHETRINNLEIDTIRKH